MRPNSSPDYNWLCSPRLSTDPTMLITHIFPIFFFFFRFVFSFFRFFSFHFFFHFQSDFFIDFFIVFRFLFFSFFFSFETFFFFFQISCIYSNCTKSVFPLYLINRLQYQLQTNFLSSTRQCGSNELSYVFWERLVFEKLCFPPKSVFPLFLCNRVHQRILTSLCIFS